VINMKIQLDPKVVWKLEEIATKAGQSVTEYMAGVAEREVQKPTVRIDWYEGAANRIHKLMDHGRTDNYIAELLGLSRRTVYRRRQVWLLGAGNEEPKETA